MTVGEGEPEAPPSTTSALTAAVAIVAVLALLLGGTVALVKAGDRPDPAEHAAMAMVAPEGVLELASVSTAVADEYRHAAEHREVYDQLRCWCGCEPAFGHRHLTDCFVRDDGSWEAHGAGCGVCIASAMVARELHDAGEPVDVIATEIDTRFGPPPSARAAGAPGPTPQDQT